MPITLRGYCEDDAVALAAIVGAALPHFLVTPAVMRWRAHAMPARARRKAVVAERAGSVLGYAAAQLDWESSETGHGELQVVVAAEERGTGAGQALLRAGEDHLRTAGAHTVRTWMNDDGSADWARRRGYRPRRRHLQPRLDLAAALPPAESGPDVEVRTFTDFADAPRTVYELDCAVSLGEPGDLPASAPSYDDWARVQWGLPTLDHDLSRIAMVHGTAAALTFVAADGTGRMRSGMTGVLPDHRGRGLAKFLKASALHEARRRGLREAYTGNDAENAPMRAVNDWLGYRPFAVEIELARELG